MRRGALHRAGPRVVGLAAVVHPLLLVGATAAAAHLDAFVAGTAADVGSAVLTVLVVLLWVGGLFLGDTVSWFLSALAVGVAVTAVSDATRASALQERGERTSCTVVTIVERIEYTAHVRPDGGAVPAQGPFPAPPPPGPGSAPIGGSDHEPTPTTHYDYALTCESGPVTRADWTVRPAGTGDRLEIVYDPLQLIGPEPVTDPADPDVRTPRTTAVVATLTAVALRTAGALWPSLHGLHRRWRRPPRR